MLTLALVVSGFLAATPVIQQPIAAAQQIEAGRESLAKGDYATASATFKNALEVARRAEDTTMMARVLFYIGLTKQEEAQRVSGAEAESLRDEATAAYRLCLELNPKLGGTMNNLAEIHIARQQYDEARELLTRAIELNDHRRSYYAAKLAQLESKSGSGRDEHYWQLVASDPKATTSQRMLVIDYFQRVNKEEELVAYLWKTVGLLQSDLALSSAFSAIENRTVDGDELEAMWAIAATALAQKKYDQSQLFSAGITPRLQRLGQPPRSDEFAKSILDLYAGAFEDAKTFDRWDVELDEDDIPHDLSPRRAIRDLARAIGRRALVARDWKRALTYFQLAQQLGTPGDPRPILDLASLYYAQGNVAELDKLLRDFDEVLYGAKALVMADGSLDELYEFHRSLGTMYAWLKRPPDSARPFATARYHLERAIEVAGRIPSPFEIDPGVKKLLGDIYAADRPADSLSLRLDAAEAYAKKGDLVAVREVVATIPYGAIQTPEQRKRYDDLVAPAVTFVEPVDVPVPAAVKGHLIVLASSQDKAARNAAEIQLRDLGVLQVSIEQGRGSLLLMGAKQRVSFQLANNLTVE